MESITIHKVNLLGLNPGSYITSTNLLLYEPCEVCAIHLFSISPLFCTEKTSQGIYSHKQQKNTPTCFKMCQECIVI